MLIIVNGYTASGKDYAVKYISNKYNIPIAISHTTRPMRPNEVDGIDYYFVTEKEFFTNTYAIEPRIYNTVYGKWYYGIKDEKLDNKIVILDFYGTQKMCEHLGRNNVFVINIDVCLDVIVERASKRDGLSKEFDRRIKDDIIQFKGVKKYANVVVTNNYSKDEFELKLDEIIKEKGFDKNG